MMARPEFSSPLSSLPLFEQYCLALMSLRRNLHPRDLSISHSLPQSVVSASVLRFILAMYEFLVPTYTQWEKRDDMTFLPDIFQQKPIGDCVCIVSFLQVNNFQRERDCKYLIGFSLTGLISFVSKGLVSSSTDKFELMKESGLLAKISDGDQLLTISAESDEIEIYKINTALQTAKSSLFPNNNAIMAKELQSHCHRIISPFQSRFAILETLAVSHSYNLMFNCCSATFIDRLVKVCCAIHNVNFKPTPAID